MKDATKLIWLTVAKDGRCTPADIHKVLPTVPTKIINGRLNNMLGAHMMKRYPDGTVGVTMECTFPQGVKVRDAFEAMGVK